jgi:hypothetical protein
MRFNLILRCVSAVCLTMFLILGYAAPTLRAQGGEPQYFAIRGAKILPVSSPPVENATIVISRGLITAVGKDASVPPEAWVIDGKGLLARGSAWSRGPALVHAVAQRCRRSEPQRQAH